MPPQAKRDNDTEAPAFLRSTAGNPDMGVHLHDEGPVSYLGARSLEHPFGFPRSMRRSLAIIVAVAVAISAALLIAYNVKVAMDVGASEALVGEAISRGVTLDLPQLESYVGKTNKAMMQQFSEDGYTIYDNSNEEDENVNGFDVFKLAPDVDADEAAQAYSQGIENLDAVDAARYLAGSWRFLVSRADGAEIRLRYADFDAQDAQGAIESAAASQGFEVEASNIAEDTLGNTSVEGTFDKAGKTYRYTISACDLSQVYDIAGAPSSAQFVGIRVVEETS